MKTMKLIAAGIAIAAALSACSQSEKPRHAGSEGQKWLTFGSIYVSRIKDDETGAVCYVTNVGGIDCIESRVKP